MKNVYIVTAALCVFLGMQGVYADANAKDEKNGAAKEEAAETPEKKVRKPKKKLEYISPLEAKAVAEAWNCPVVALVLLKGSKQSQKLRSRYFQRADLKKELFLPNAVFLTIEVPSEEKKAPRRSGRDRSSGRSEPTILPLINELNPQQLVMMTSLGTGGKHRITEGYFPQLAVFSPQGRLLGSFTPSPDGSTPLSEIVSGFKSCLTAGKYEFTLTSKMERLVEKDTKRREKAAKRERK